MKKKYAAPKLSVELYELSGSIASNCAIVVSNGPEMGGHSPCDDYEALVNGRMARSANVVFYEDSNCDCYTTGGASGFWQS